MGPLLFNLHINENKKNPYGLELLLCSSVK